MDVIDPRTTALAEASLAVRMRLLRIKVLLQPLDVVRAPRPGLAVAAELTSLGIVRVTWNVPVADIDDVKQR